MKRQSGWSLKFGPKSRGVSFVLILALALTAMPGVALATGSPADRAGMDTVVRGFPTATTPNVSGPRVTNYVSGLAEVGSKIVAGGNFSSVRNPGSSTEIPRNFLFAFDKATGIVDANFVPAVNGVVEAVVAHPDGQSVFIVGNFSTVNGQASFGIAKLNINTGQRVVGFTTTTQGRVRDAVLSGTRLFLAGDFWRVGTVTRNRLAAIDINTGAVDTNFAPVVGAPRGGTSSWVTGIDVSPDGTRAVVIGNFLTIDNESRVQIAMIDLTTSPNTLANWSTQGYASACNTNAFWTYMRDVEFSPDNQYFVAATTGGPYPGTLCDSAARWETAAQGSNLLPTWSNLSGGDTLTAVAVTKAAVYIGGHQRWMNNPLGRDSALIGAVSREGISALDPLNGVPLRWNPGRDRGATLFELLITSGGLFVGHDTNLVNFLQREKLAFFPRQGGTTVPVPTPVNLPASFYQVQQLGTITKADYNGTTVTPRITVPNTGDWSAARGVTLEAGYVYYTQTDNRLYRKSFDGTTFGAAEDLVTGVYAGAAPTLTNINGLSWDNGRLYYTRTGDSQLRYRYLSLESGILGGVEFTASGGINWIGTTGIEFVGSHLYYTKTDLNLWRVNVVNGQPVSGTQVAISGPAIDGRTWAGNDSFVTPLVVDPAPTVSVTAPTAGATVSGSVTLSASAADNGTVTSVNFTVDGNSVGIDSNGADGWSVLWNSTTATDGAHNVGAVATDNLNQTGTATPVAVTVDNDPAPTVSVTAPTAGATVSGTVPITANATDNIGVTSVNFTVDGNSVGIDSNGADGWSVQWNSTTATDGAHNVGAVATDNLNQTGTATPVAVTVDNDPAPTVSVTAPTAGATVSGSVPITANATDNIGVTSVNFTVDGNSVGIDSNGADGWSVQWNSTTATDGAHNVGAVATDNLNQTGTATPVAVTVDNDPAPTVSVTAPTAGATVSGSVTLSASAADNGTVTSVNFTVDGNSVGIDSNGADGWSVQWNSLTAQNGAHSISAVATDNLNQTTTATPVSVTVANGGGSTVLMVVAAPAALNTGEVAVRNRLTGNGYTVVIVDDNAVTAADANGKAFVILSSTVTVNSVPAIFKSLAIPVWVAKPFFLDDFGMTGPVADVDYGSKLVSTIQIVNPAHPLAAGKSGSVALRSGTYRVSFGVAAASATIVANADGPATVFTIAAGAQLAGGTDTAAGCRLTFPIFQDVPQFYNNDAWSMFDAAATYATNGCT